MSVIRTEGDRIVLYDPATGTEYLELDFAANEVNAKQSLSETANRVATRTWAQNNNIDHNDLGTVNSDDHHSKTSSASELSDVSPDSTGDAHHSRPSAGNALNDNSGTFDVDESAIDADKVDGYDIQKNGTDGSGVINFKT